MDHNRNHGQPNPYPYASGRQRNNHHDTTASTAAAAATSPSYSSLGRNNGNFGTSRHPINNNSNNDTHHHQHQHPHPHHHTVQRPSPLGTGMRQVPTFHQQQQNVARRLQREHQMGRHQQLQQPQNGHTGSPLPPPSLFSRSDMGSSLSQPPQQHHNQHQRQRNLSPPLLPPPPGNRPFQHHDKNRFHQHNHNHNHGHDHLPHHQLQYPNHSPRNTQHSPTGRQHQQQQQQAHFPNRSLSPPHASPAPIRPFQQPYSPSPPPHFLRQQQQTTRFPHPQQDSPSREPQQPQQPQMVSRNEQQQHRMQHSHNQQRMQEPHRQQQPTHSPLWKQQTPPPPQQEQQRHHPHEQTNRNLESNTRPLAASMGSTSTSREQQQQQQPGQRSNGHAEAGTVFRLSRAQRHNLSSSESIPSKQPETISLLDNSDSEPEIETTNVNARQVAPPTTINHRHHSELSAIKSSSSPPSGATSYQGGKFNDMPSAGTSSTAISTSTTAIAKNSKPPPAAVATSFPGKTEATAATTESQSQQQQQVVTDMVYSPPSPKEQQPSPPSEQLQKSTNQAQTLAPNNPPDASKLGQHKKLSPDKPVIELSEDESEDNDDDDKEGDNELTNAKTHVQHSPAIKQPPQATLTSATTSTTTTASSSAPFGPSDSRQDVDKRALLFQQKLCGFLKPPPAVKSALKDYGPSSVIAVPSNALGPPAATKRKRPPSYDLLVDSSDEDEASKMTKDQSLRKVGADSSTGKSIDSGTKENPGPDRYSSSLSGSGESEGGNERSDPSEAGNSNAILSNGYSTRSSDEEQRVVQPIKQTARKSAGMRAGSNYLTPSSMKLASGRRNAKASVRRGPRKLNMCFSSDTEEQSDETSNDEDNKDDDDDDDESVTAEENGSAAMDSGNNSGNDRICNASGEEIMVYNKENLRNLVERTTSSFSHSGQKRLPRKSAKGSFKFPCYSSHPSSSSSSEASTGSECRKVITNADGRSNRKQILVFRNQPQYQNVKTIRGKPAAPLGAFEIFVQEAQLQGSVSEDLTIRWQQLSPNERGDYEQVAKLNLQQHIREKQFFTIQPRISNGGQSSTLSYQGEHPTLWQEYYHHCAPIGFPASTGGKTASAPRVDAVSGAILNGNTGSLGNTLSGPQIVANSFAVLQPQQFGRIVHERQPYLKQLNATQMIQPQGLQGNAMAQVKSNAQPAFLESSVKQQKSNSAQTFESSKQKSKRGRKRKSSKNGSSSENSSNFARKLIVRTPSPLPRRRRTRPTLFRDEQLQDLCESPHATAGTSYERDGIPEEMMIVDHMSGIEINPETGLPVGKFTVTGLSADILYSFRVDIAPSRIPNSGFGAFLTFLGARHLKEAAKVKNSARLNKEKLYCINPLEAIGDDGFGINVKIVGSVVGDGKSKRPRGIGPNFVYNESDYGDTSPDTVFSSYGEDNGLIDLGRYGPFRRIDRKPILHFDVKSFFFGHEPSEWCFGCQEQLFGRVEQIIDITDDSTGKTHEIAQQNLPMYVNEVGHNKKLTHNVEALERHDRSVHYYIKIVKPMAKGQQVELLTNYGDVYEDIRERKGYGMRNLGQGLKSDEDAKARFRRNVELREVVASRIEEVDLLHLYEMMEFVEEKIRLPLVQLTNRYLKFSKGSVSTRASKVQVPSSLQWVALVRIQWFEKWLSQRLRELPESEDTRRLVAFGLKSMLPQCEEWVRNLKWESFSEFLALDGNIKDADGNNIRDAVCREIFDLTWYDLGRELPAPFDKSMWCPIAFQLFEQISMDVARCTWTKDPSSTTLQEKIYSAAAKAAEQIRKASKNGLFENYAGLEFESGVQTNAHVLSEEVASIRRSFFEGHSMNPKGLLATLHEIQAYSDCSYLLDDYGLDDFSLSVVANDQFVMTEYAAFYGSSNISSIPRSIETCRKLKAKVNELWYIVWQVVFVAHAFAKKHLPDDGAEKSSAPQGYSLEQLCARVGVDLVLAQESIKQGIRPSTLSEHNRTFRRKRKRQASTSRPQKTSNKSKKTAQNGDKSKKTALSGAALDALRSKAIEVWKGPPEEPINGGWPPGWTKKIYQRQGGVSKGHRDRYWLTPQKNYKIRSIVDVHRFLGVLATVSGNEELAWKIFQRKPSCST